MSSYHTSIMIKEVVELLSCSSKGFYVDCTVGGGGHSREILKASSPDGRILCIDKDQNAIKESKKNLEDYLSRIIFVHSDYKRLGEILSEKEITGVDGILADLGVSSHQLDDGARGFSFMKEGPLDMRMDSGSGETASELIERCSFEELRDIIRRYGEEKWAGPIAKSIKEAGTIKTTTDLVPLVYKAVPRRCHPKNINVATKTFQALRIAVNEELLDLDSFISNAVTLLKKGGRIAIISFHSLEDRIVKRIFKNLAKGCICPSDLPICRCGKSPVVRLITRKPVTPSYKEIELNPRSRSAKLRVAERV